MNDKKFTNEDMLNFANYCHIRELEMQVAGIKDYNILRECFDISSLLKWDMKRNAFPS